MRKTPRPPGLTAAMPFLVAITSPATARDLGIDAAMPVGTALLAPAAACLAAFIVWRLVRALGGLLVLSGVVALVVTFLLAVHGNIDLDWVFAP